MSSKCTAAKAYDILGIYDFPDDFDALNGLHSYFYASNDMVVEALASQKYDLARQTVPSSPPRRWQKPVISPSSITRRSWRWGISTPF